MNGVIFYLERECFVYRKDAQVWGGRFSHAHLYSKHLSLGFQEQRDITSESAEVESRYQWTRFTEVIKLSWFSMAVVVVYIEIFVCANL